MNADEFRVNAKKMVDYVADYLEKIDERRVVPTVKPGYLQKLIPDHAPEDGETFESVFNDIEKIIMPGVTHWHSPHFHAYFPTGCSFPSICADILSDAIACIGFSWIASPACTELEMAMMDWLGKMLNLPPQYLFSSGGKGGGVIQVTASDSTFICLLAARSQIFQKLKSQDSSFNEYDVLKKLVAYTSEEAHSSVERAHKLAGIAIRKLPTDVNFSFRGKTLKDAIDEDRKSGKIPFLATATLGTTSSCAFDNLPELGNVCKEEELWLHVDAAYAGSSFICPEFRSPLDGIELTDSFSFNPHKWLLVNFDCSALWIRDSDYLVKAFDVDPLYLKHEHQGIIPDYRHWQIPLGRRFRSLKLWFVLRMYGVKGLQAYIRKHVALAKEFEKLVQSDKRFEIMAPTVLGLVCFRLKGDNVTNEKLLKRINDEGKIFLVPCNLREKFTIRFAVCSYQTESKHVEYAWKEIQNQVKIILKE